MERMGLSELHLGDALAVLRTLPSASVHCCITSPPYFGLRDYGTGKWEGGDGSVCDHAKPPSGGLQKGATLSGSGNREGYSSDGQYRDTCGKCGARRVDQQLGLEATPELFVAKMVEVFREVRRVLRPDGTLWLNLGDGYGGGKQGGGTVFSNGRTDGTPTRASSEARTLIARKCLKERTHTGLPSKNLLGMPWRVALALQADGWHLRADIIWHKPNPMPESVRDRPTKSHEYIFLLSRSAKYFYDGEAVAEPAIPAERVTGPNNGSARQALANNKKPSGNGVPGAVMRTGDTRNLRSVWRIATQAYRGAHFACFPAALPERCIRAGTSAHGCCPACGAPWVRVVERGERVATSERGQHGYRLQKKDESGLVAMTHYEANGVMPGQAYSYTTTGWQQACKCPPVPPVPCTVLDPFMGSATTLMVANLLGRRGVGIELSPQYLDLARKRLRDALGMFALGEE